MLDIDDINITGGDFTVVPNEQNSDYVITSIRFVDEIETLTITANDGRSYIITVKDANRPDHTKTLTDNGNGTYELALTVTGAINTGNENNGANILIVYDVSNSMTTMSKGAAVEDQHGMRGATSGWSQSFIDLYGYINGEYVNFFTY